jgi:hypothetical protein
MYRFARNEEIDVNEPRVRLRKMSDEELVRFGKAARLMCIKYNRRSGVNFGPVHIVRFAEAFGATGLQIDHPNQIASILREAFDLPGPVLVGVQVDYKQNVKLFEQVHEGSIL